MHNADTLPQEEQLVIADNDARVRRGAERFHPVTAAGVDHFLFDFSIAPKYAKETSYLGKQNEVVDMVDNLDKDRWPGLWYEFLQGAYDYNDNTKGRVAVNIWYFGVDEPVSFKQFLLDCREKGLPNLQVEAVTVENYIKGDTGLRPRNIALTDHDEKVLTGTLGVHGRGLKIASTAIFQGNLAKGISYSSWVPDMGTWYGEGEMAADPVDMTSPKAFKINYKTDKSVRAEKTIFRVSEPSLEALEALADLPKWFLPLNEQYEFSRLPDGDSESAIPNRLTVFANPEMVTADSANQQSWDFRFLHITAGQGSMYDRMKDLTSEPPRAEILDPALAGGQESPYDFVFVDGLKVKVRGRKLCQLYAFWGWGNGTEQGYNPKRSNDSIWLTQSFDALLQQLVDKNQTVEVFYEILRMAIDKQAEYVEELAFFRFSDLHNLKDGDKKNALATAWERVVTEKFQGDVPDPYYLAETARQQIDAMGRKLPYIKFESSAWYSIIARNLPIPTIQQVIDLEMEKYQADIKRLGDEKRLVEQRLAETQKQAAEETRRRKGIRKEAESTGEVIKVTFQAEPAVILESLRGHFRFISAQNTVTVPQLGDDGVFSINGHFSAEHLPLDVVDLGATLDFIRQYLAIYGDHHRIELRVSIGGSGVYFLFDRGDNRDTNGAFSVHIERGVIETPGMSVFELTIIPNVSAKASVVEVPMKSTEFLQMCASDLQEMSLDGVVNRELYQEKFGSTYPASLAAMKIRMALEAEQKELIEKFAALNKAREQAGLPPKPSPFMLDKNGVVVSTSRSTSETSTTSSDSGGTSSGKEFDVQKLFPRSEPEIIINDVPSSEMTIRLLHPMSAIGLSTRGKTRPAWEEAYRNGSPAQQAAIIDEIRVRHERRVESIAHPDFSLFSGKGKVLPGYLISHLNPHFSEITLHDFVVLKQLPNEELAGAPHVVFHKQLETGLGTLAVPPGYKPAAFSGEGIDTSSFVLSGHMATRQYAINITKKLPAGLTIYFKKDHHIDVRTPNEKQKKVIALYDGLQPHWKKIIDVLRIAPLSDKRKNDMLMLAWVKAFTYDDSQSSFDQYQHVRDLPDEFVTEIINSASGDCGYAMRGFHGLLSLIGLPSEEFGSFLASEKGQFNLKSNYHGLSNVYLDGVWALVEPQRGYLQEGYINEQFAASTNSEDERVALLQLREIIAGIEPSKYRNPELQVRMLLDVPKDAADADSEMNSGVARLWERMSGLDEDVDQPVEKGRKVKKVEIYHVGDDSYAEIKEKEEKEQFIPDTIDHHIKENFWDPPVDGVEIRTIGKNEKQLVVDSKVQSIALDEPMFAVKNIDSVVGVAPDMVEAKPLPIWFRAISRLGVPVGSTILGIQIFNQASILIASLNVGSGIERGEGVMHKPGPLAAIGRTMRGILENASADSPPAKTVLIETAVEGFKHMGELTSSQKSNQIPFVQLLGAVAAGALIDEIVRAVSRQWRSQRQAGEDSQSERSGTFAVTPTDDLLFKALDEFNLEESNQAEGETTEHILSF